MNAKTRFNVLYVLIAVSGVFLVHDLWVRSQAVAVIPYSQFQQLLADGKVQEVIVDADALQGVLKEPLAVGPGQGRSRFATTRVSADLAASLEKHGVTFTGRIESPWLHAVLSWAVPVLLFGALWMWFARRVGGPDGPGGGLMAIGKSKAKVFVETGVKARFADVAGVDEAKAELEEVVAFLKDPKYYGRLGARMPKGVLLVGPPGTGKTLLAARSRARRRCRSSPSAAPSSWRCSSAWARRASAISSSRRGPRRPRIIFIDELDALGRARGASGGWAGTTRRSRRSTSCWSSSTASIRATGIVLLGATNRPEILDPALLRAGRFDRQVLVDRPDRPGGSQILRCT